MRTGDFKQTYGELVTLVDSPPVWLWSAVLVAGLIAWLGVRPSDERSRGSGTRPAGPLA